jgi:hypothetical protein
MKGFESPDQWESREEERKDREELKNLGNSDLAAFLLRWLAVFYDKGGVNLGRSTRSNLLDCIFDLDVSHYNRESSGEIGDTRAIPDYPVGLEEAEGRVKAGKIPARQMEIEFPLNSVEELSDERLVCGILAILLEEQEEIDKRNEMADFGNLSVDKRDEMADFGNLYVERRLIRAASLLLPNFKEPPFSAPELMREAQRRWEERRAGGDSGVG